LPSCREIALQRKNTKNVDWAIFPRRSMRTKAEKSDELTTYSKAESLTPEKIEAAFSILEHSSDHDRLGTRTRSRHGAGVSRHGEDLLSQATESLV